MLSKASLVMPLSKALYSGGTADSKKSLVVPKSMNTEKSECTFQQKTASMHNQHLPDKRTHKPLLGRAVNDLIVSIFQSILLCSL